MITAKFFENELKDRFEITITGHAQAAEKGKDLICAGTSVLSLTLLQVIKTMESQGFFVNNVKAKVKDGFTSIMCKPKAEYYQTVLNSILTLKTGFNMLATMFGGYIEVVDVGNV